MLLLLLHCLQVFAAYVLCGAQDKDAVRLTLEQVDLIRRVCTEYQELELVTSADGKPQVTQRHVMIMQDRNMS